MLVSKFDVYNVVSRLCGTVGDPACAILQILCVDVYFARALNGQTKPTVACISGVNNKLCRLKGMTFMKTLTFVVNISEMI